MKLRRYSKKEDALIKECVQKGMVATEIAETLTEAGYPRNYGSVYMRCRALGIKIPKRRATPAPPPRQRARYQIGKSGQIGVHTPKGHKDQWQGWLDTVSDVMHDARGYPTLTKAVAYCLQAGAEKAEREASE